MGPHCLGLLDIGGGLGSDLPSSGGVRGVGFARQPWLGISSYAWDGEACGELVRQIDRTERVGAGVRLAWMALALTPGDGSDPVRQGGGAGVCGLADRA